LTLWRAPLYFTSTYWTKQLIGADKANRQGFNGEGVTTIVIDTGGTQFNRQTPQLQKHTAVYGNDVDSIGHGEWCASCIAGRTVTDDLFTVMQGKPVVCEGIAQACNIVEVKALDYVEGAGTDAELIRALYMSLQLGADIISCSWGGQENASNPEEDPYYKPIQTLVQASVIPVFAAGNSGPNPSTLSSPGWLPQVLTVGSYNAVDNSQVSSFGPAGEVSNFSSRGPTPWGDIKPDTVGPGAIIDSGITGWMMGSYTGVVHPFQAIAGTSMATPHIAGLVTLMRQAHRQLLGKVLTVDEVKEVLKSSGIEKTNDYGWGPLTWDLYLSYLETTYGLKLSG
jgi:serine protease AprX